MSSEPPRAADVGRMLAPGPARGVARSREPAAWVLGAALPIVLAWAAAGAHDVGVVLLGLLAVLAVSMLGGVGPGLLAVALLALERVGGTGGMSLLGRDPVLVLTLVLEIVLGVSIAALAGRLRASDRRHGALLALLARERAESRRRDAEARRLAEDAEAGRRRAEEAERELRIARELARVPPLLGPGLPSAPRLHRGGVPLHIFPPPTSDWLG